MNWKKHLQFNLTPLHRKQKKTKVNNLLHKAEGERSSSAPRGNQNHQFASRCFVRKSENKTFSTQELKIRFFIFQSWFTQHLKVFCNILEKNTNCRPETCTKWQLKFAGFKKSFTEFWFVFSIKDVQYDSLKDFREQYMRYSGNRADTELNANKLTSYFPKQLWVKPNFCCRGKFSDSPVCWLWKPWPAVCSS